jgi:hypothetical protein
MKALATLIERQLRAGKGNHCAVYEHELIRIWPLDEPDREAKIAQFAKEYGFRLRFYRLGMCAIFDKWTPTGHMTADHMLRKINH